MRFAGNSREQCQKPGGRKEVAEGVRYAFLRNPGRRMRVSQEALLEGRAPENAPNRSHLQLATAERGAPGGPIQRRRMVGIGFEIAQERHNRLRSLLCS